MARHVARPDPRAHWLLLLLGLLALLAALSFNGLVTNVGGGSGPSVAPASPAPRQVTAGGPVLRLDGPTPVARRMPPRTIALTFDDGPDPRWTPQMLDVLAPAPRARHVLRGRLAGRRAPRAGPADPRRGARDRLAHLHPRRPDRGAELAARGSNSPGPSNAIAGATGREVDPAAGRRTRRPPTRSPNAQYQALRDAAGSGYLTVLADRDTRDWQRPGVRAIVRGRHARRAGRARWC